MKKIVENYKVLIEIPKGLAKIHGDSVSPKGMVFHLIDNTKSVSVLDIGFGLGNLGRLIKTRKESQHWIVDGIDGDISNCNNIGLFQKKYYRNIWHGLAQELTSEVFRQYNIICLLDVIEHVDAQTAKWLFRSILTNMADDALFFISTPLWFYPQESINANDLEEHLIGVPASSMIALQPLMYATNHPLVGGFVLGKKSLDFVDFFEPTSNKSLTYDKGLAIANAIRMGLEPGIIYKQV
jgi:2-polyprenyl-3-methyl-5-hydroxy-6-metoxy-1,4-benzoquinol methylase